MYNGTRYVDISNLIETNMNIQDKLDLTLDFASIVIPHAKASYTDIPDIDFSKPIKPWTPIMIDINNGFEIYRFYTTNSPISIIGKGTEKRYRHEISLVEASKSLFGKVIPDMTITQPKSVLFSAATFSDSKTDMGVYPDDYTTITTTEETLPLILINESNDTSVIEGRVLKESGRDYKIVIIADIYNLTSNIDLGMTYSRTNAETTLVLDIYSGSTKLETKSYFIPSATVDPLSLENEESRRYISILYPYTTSASNEEISIKAKVVGTYTVTIFTPYSKTVYADFVRANVYLTLYTEKDDPEEEYKYIDSEVEKILASVNTNYGTNFHLSDSTKALLSNPRIEAPEFTFQSYTAWDALEKLANYVNAIPEVGLEDFNEVSFTFLDDEPDLEYDISRFTDETATYLFDDYNAGFEINATNMVEEDILKSVKVEPYIRG
jgi:hypothetical protein